MHPVYVLRHHPRRRARESLPCPAPPVMPECRKSLPLYEKPASTSSWLMWSTWWEASVEQPCNSAVCTSIDSGRQQQRRS